MVKPANKPQRLSLSSLKADFSSAVSRRRLVYLLCTFFVIYALCYQWQFLVSLGLGPDNIHHMTVGLIPAVGAVVLSLALYWRHLCIASVVPTALIAVSWIVTGPYLSYITLIQQNTVYLGEIKARTLRP